MDKKIRLLLVDDTPELHSTIYAEALIKKCTPEIIQASNSASAIQLLTSNYFDGIVCNYDNTACDYAPVVRFLSEQGLGIPVFVIAAQCSRTMIIDALRSGVMYCFDICDVELLFACLQREFSKTGMLSFQRAFEDLRDSLKSLHSIIDSSIDAIVVCDKNRNLLKTNTAFLRMIQMNTEDVIGRPLSAFSVTTPGYFESYTGEKIVIDADCIAKDIDKMRELYSRGISTGWKTFFLRRDNTVVPVEQNAAFIL